MLYFNNCSLNYDGIFLDGSYGTNYNTLSNNVVSFNEYRGIFLLRYHHVTNTGAHHNNLLNNSIFDNEIGLYFSMASQNTIRNNSITGNKVAFHLTGDAKNNNAHFNDLSRNQEYGIQVHSGSVNATYNWWGHESGPYHRTENRHAKGTKVTDDVLFDPWLKVESNKPPTANISSIFPNPVCESKELKFLGSASVMSSIKRRKVYNKEPS